MTEGTTAALEATDPDGPIGSLPLVDVVITTDDPDRVGALIRLAAYALDALILAVAIYIVALVLRAALGPTLRITDVGGVQRIQVDRLRTVVNAVAATIVTGTYFVGWWLRSGSTPGQRLIRARVEQADGSGRLRLGQAVGRWLLLGTPLGLLATLVGPPSAFGLFFVAYIATWDAVLFVTTARHRRKRGLHDRLSGSIVRRVPRRAL
jgi:RDD family.